MNVERMKELRIMKTTLRYLLIVIGLASVLSVGAQGLAQQPGNDMRSTSAMAGSGSFYSSSPMLTAEGMALYEGAESSSQNFAPSIRRIGPPTPEGDPTPIGDALLPLMVMAMGFGGVIYLRRKRA